MERLIRGCWGMDAPGKVLLNLSTKYRDCVARHRC